MNLNRQQTELLEHWLADKSFLNWVNQLNEQDCAKWELYFNEHPEHWELAKMGKVLAAGILFKNIATNKQQSRKALTVLLSKIDNAPAVNTTKTKATIFQLKRVWKVAASLAILVCLSGLIYFQFFSNTKVVLATNYGEQLETTLPDGSAITLNANSTLTYFTNNPRHTWLIGEAFFKIKKKPTTNENFQVFTEDLTVTVLGTSFNVNSRNEKTKIFLEEGKVKLKLVEAKMNTVEMKPGEEVIYSKKNKKLTETKTNVSAIKNTSWKEGALIFKETPFLTALYEIEDIYGIQFVLQSDDLKNKVIAGGVPIKNLKVTLETLKAAYGINIQKEGKRYFLSTKK